MIKTTYCAGQKTQRKVKYEKFNQPKTICHVLLDLCLL